MPYSPLFRAQHADRLRRHKLIREYEEAYSCKLVVMIDTIYDDSVTYVQELLHDSQKETDLHFILDSPGGFGEIALRIARLAQASSKKFVIIVPNQAKSAATILALSAHKIIMGPASDLGPIDPQLYVPRQGFVAAKDLIQGVKSAILGVSENSDSYPIYIAMLTGINTTNLERAKSALESTETLAKLAIKSNPDREPGQVYNLLRAIKGPLIEEPKDHSAVIGAAEAIKMRLPIQRMDMNDNQWKMIWSIWSEYVNVLATKKTTSIYESQSVSQLFIRAEESMLEEEEEEED